MMNVKVKIYDGVKYDKESKKVGEVVYHFIKGFEVKKMTDEEVYAEGYYDEVDKYGEYLVITLQNGKTATYLNSNVDIFSI